MTTQEGVSLVGSLGFPIVLVLGLLWFVKRDLWPWYMQYMQERAVAQDERHKEYQAAVMRSNAAVEALVTLITKIDQRLEDHTRRLQIIEAASRAAAARGESGRD